MTERLGKLQKWVLGQIHTQGAISKKSLKSFYGKAPSDTEGQGQTFHEYTCGLPLTTSQRVTIHRSLRNMLRKGLIRLGQYGSFCLTEKGFTVLLNANESLAGETNVSFKDYEERRKKDLAEYEDDLKVLKSMLKRTA